MSAAIAWSMHCLSMFSGASSCGQTAMPMSKKITINLFGHHKVTMHANKIVNKLTEAAIRSYQA
jgi:hypothetical protein